MKPTGQRAVLTWGPWCLSLVSTETALRGDELLAFGSKISSSEEKHFFVSGLHQPCHIFSTGYKGGQSVGLTLQAHSNFRDKTRGLGVLSCSRKLLFHSLGGTLAQKFPTQRIQWCAARLGEISPSGSFMDETNWAKSRSKLGTMVSFPSLHRNSTLRWRAAGVW